MQEKPFDLTAIVLLLILAVTNDALIVLADLAFLIPVIGQITFLAMMAASFVIWGIIFFWFTMKLGFAGPIGLIQIGGGILAEIGVPVRTATVITGIFMANNPKAAKIAKLATGAGAVATTGGAATVVEGGAVAGGAAAGAEVAAAGETAAGAAEGAAGEIATKTAAGAGAPGEIGGAYEYNVEKEAEREAFEEKRVEAKTPEEDEEIGGKIKRAEKESPKPEEATGEKLTAGEKTAKAAEEQERVFGGETRAPVEKAGEELLGENPLKESVQPEKETPAEVNEEAKSVPEPEGNKGIGGRVIEAAERFHPKTEEVEKKEEEEKKGGEIAGAYDQEKQAMGAMTGESEGLFEAPKTGGSEKKSKDVEAKANMVNLRGEEKEGENLKKAA